MIYCVELAFSEPAREAQWNAWYSAHLGILLSIPGISTAQRLEATAPCHAPYLAAYSVAAPEVFESAPYKQRGGRGAPGVWAPMMINWDRNLFDGLEQMPEVGPDQYLVLADLAPDELAKFPVTLHQLSCAGLDRTVQSRGIAVLSANEQSKLAMRANERIRFYKALTPRLCSVN
jgi:hypothetical protein